MDNGKQAQITVDEMARHDDVSLLMPYIWYTARKKPLEKSGLNFDYSDIIKERFKKNELKSDEKEGEPDDNN